MRFVLWGTYCENALEKRAPYREEHLAGLQRLKDDGIFCVHRDSIYSYCCTCYSKFGY